MPQKRIHHKCPACGKVSYFQPGEVIVCRACGAAPPATGAAPLGGDGAGHGPPPSGPPRFDTETGLPLTDAPGQEPVTIIVQQQQSMGGEGGGRGLAIASLVAGGLAFMTVLAFPLAMMLAIVAVVTGIIGLSKNDDDPGTTAMGVIGMSLGVLVLVLALILAFSFDAADSGSSNDGGGSSNDGGGGSSGDPGGGSGGNSGGGAGGGGGDVGAPGPGLIVPVVALLIAWKRR